MTENIGGPSAPYNVTIPSITDNADIQTALRLYHYGTDTSTPSTIPEESIAGHLNVLENAKIAKDPASIPVNGNLNDYTSTGFYVQPGTPNAPNYPSNHAGLLTVISDGGFIFQQYQVIGAPETEDESSIQPVNRTHWRFFSAGTWKSWRTFIDSSEFSIIGDGRYVLGLGGQNETFISNYYTKSEADTEFYTKAEADSAQYVSENLVGGTSYTLSLADTSKVVAIDSSGDFTLTIPLNSAIAFPIGTIINVYAMNNNQVVVQGATGVTVRPFANNKFQFFGQYTEISLRKRATNEWVASGNILEV